MSDITVALTDRQREDLERAARDAGMTIEEYAALAVSQAVEKRYVLPSMHGTVIPIQGLNRNRKP